MVDKERAEASQSELLFFSARFILAAGECQSETHNCKDNSDKWYHDEHHFHVLDSIDQNAVLLKPSVRGDVEVRLEFQFDPKLWEGTEPAENVLTASYGDIVFSSCN